MARKTHDLAVAIREYQTNSGETKKQWQNIGAVIEYDDGGKSLLIERWFNPAGIPGDGAVRISMFEPRPRDGQQTQQPKPQMAKNYTNPQTGAPEVGGFDDSEIPF